MFATTSSLDLILPILFAYLAFEIEVASVYFLFESPKSDETQKAREEVEEEGSSKNTNIAPGVEEPGSNGLRDCIGPVPHHIQHGKSDHSVSRE